MSEVQLRAGGATAPTLATMLAAPHQLVALAFGLGLSPYAPGTLGTIAGFALFATLQPLPPHYRVVAYCLLLLLATWACQRTGDDLDSPDHNAIVIDETLGMSLVLEFVAPTALVWAAAFLLFRLFDVWKPWPVYLADRHGRGGFHVLLDDLLATAYAVLVIRLVSPIFL